MKKALGLVLCFWLMRTVSAQDFNKIEYLCCDWGPAMTLPTKTNEEAQFNDAEDEVYYLKQVTSLTRKTPLFGGRAQNISHGTSIYLCKMKADGSGKTEIKELWKHPAYPIDTQDQNTWMEVNRKARKIAFSISYGGGAIAGLWSVSLDGSEPKQLIKPASDGPLQTINSPSWTPDGEWLYFEEMLHKHPDRISILRCDAFGANITRILEATVKIQYKEPRVSPDGKLLAFSRYPNGYPGGSFIWTSNLVGTDAKPLGGKDSPQNFGSYPAWSPDGRKIFFVGMSCCIADASSGKELAQNVGHSGWPHWGRLGLIGFTVGGIRFTDIELKESKSLTGSGLANKHEQNTGNAKW
jgi:hypothetical protein